MTPLREGFFNGGDMSNVSTKMTWLPKTQYKLSVSTELRKVAIEFCNKYFDEEEWHIKTDTFDSADTFYFKTYDQIDHFMHGSDEWTVIYDK